jgi:hypothetical protein
VEYIYRVLVRKHIEMWPLGKLRICKCEIKTDLKWQGITFSVGGGRDYLSFCVLSVLK